MSEKKIDELIDDFKNIRMTINNPYYPDFKKILKQSLSALLCEEIESIATSKPLNKYECITIEKIEQKIREVMK